MVESLLPQLRLFWIPWNHLRISLRKRRRYLLALRFFDEGSFGAESSSQEQAETSDACDREEEIVTLVCRRRDCEYKVVAVMPEAENHARRATGLASVVWRRVMSFSYGSATRTSLPLVLFVSAVVLVAGSGASCPNVIRGYQVGIMPLPRTLPAPTA